MSNRVFLRRLLLTRDHRKVRDLYRWTRYLNLNLLLLFLVKCGTIPSLHIRGDWHDVREGVDILLIIFFWLKSDGGIYDHLIFLLDERKLVFILNDLTSRLLHSVVV